MQEKEGDVMLESNQDKVAQGFNSIEVSGKTEDTTKLMFKIVKNDSKRQSLKILIDLKTIFSKQLPKMPKQYIVKLVFDRRHQSLVIMKDEGKVTGGICFRVFGEEKFTEIAFLAIISKEQVRGYGTKLMNRLKEEMQRRKIQYMMTYADNSALGFFQKQGFSKDLKMSADRWKGYIKDYEGGTMMECHVYPTIDYSRVTEIIKMQKIYVAKKIQERCLDIEFDGRKLQQCAKVFTRINKDGEEQVYKINPMCIPGVFEAGWNWNDHEELRKTKEISFNLQCQSILILLKNHSSIRHFKESDYETIIKDPIDLKTIQNKLTNNQYQTREAFCDDIIKIFKNSKTCNKPETMYYKQANQLQKYITPYLNNFKDGSLKVNMPMPRKLINTKKPTDKA